MGRDLFPEGMVSSAAVGLWAYAPNHCLVDQVNELVSFDSLVG